MASLFCSVLSSFLITSLEKEVAGLLASRLIYVLGVDFSTCLVFQGIRGKLRTVIVAIPFITKTCLLYYTENFTIQKMKIFR